MTQLNPASREYRSRPRRKPFCDRRVTGLALQASNQILLRKEIEEIRLIFADNSVCTVFEEFEE
jgi:hypothetical protein